MTVKSCTTFYGGPLEYGRSRVRIQLTFPCLHRINKTAGEKTLKLTLISSSTALIRFHPFFADWIVAVFLRVYNSWLRNDREDGTMTTMWKERWTSAHALNFSTTHKVLGFLLNIGLELFSPGRQSVSLVQHLRPIFEISHRIACHFRMPVSLTHIGGSSVALIRYDQRERELPSY